MTKDAGYKERERTIILKNYQSRYHDKNVLPTYMSGPKQQDINNKIYKKS